MARKVFFSFHFDADAWRAGQVRNAGVVEGDEPVTPNKWEEIKRGGDDGIKRWINEEMKGKSSLVVLVGAATAKRKWIDYEIEHAWNTKKGVVGVCIHSLKDAGGRQSTMGSNPFAHFKMEKDGASLSTIVECWSPESSVSTEAYAAIRDNLARWVERAIAIRDNYS